MRIAIVAWDIFVRCRHCNAKQYAGGRSHVYCWKCGKNISY